MNATGFEFHGAAAIGVYRQLFRVGTLLSNRRPEQDFCQLGTLPICNVEVRLYDGLCGQRPR
jgi:hypothetical protein